MGGRGGSSGFTSNNTSALPKDSKEITIETYYRKNSMYGSHYGDSVYRATEESDGNIVFSYADPSFSNSRPNANTREVTFKITHGAVTSFNSGNTQFYGINWDNVKSVSGKTFDIKGYIKEKGFKWDAKEKKWIRE